MKKKCKNRRITVLITCIFHVFCNFLHFTPIVGYLTRCSVCRLLNQMFKRVISDVYAGYLLGY